MCESAEFRERIVKLKREFGSFYKLSKRCGIPEATLRKWAEGPSEPNRTKLVAVARGAGVSVEWLAVGGDSHEEVKRTQAGCAGPNPITAPVLYRLGVLLDDYLSHDCDRETVADELSSALDALSWYRDKAQLPRKPGGGDA